MQLELYIQLGDVNGNYIIKLRPRSVCKSVLSGSKRPCVGFFHCLKYGKLGFH